MTLLMEVRYEEAGVSSVTVDVVVDASAEFAWDAVRDVYAVDTRLLRDSRCTWKGAGQQDGDVRR